MKKFKHALIAAVAIIATAVPAILADPSVAHYIAQHPWTATYFPIVSGVVVAIYHAAVGDTAKK